MAGYFYAQITGMAATKPTQLPVMVSCFWKDHWQIFPAV
jgi:hypothetical protein